MLAFLLGYKVTKLEISHLKDKNVNFSPSY